MKSDELVAEVRRIREEYAKEFDFDVRALGKDLQQRQREHPEDLVSFSPKPAHRRKTA